MNKGAESNADQRLEVGLGGTARLENASNTLPDNVHGAGSLDNVVDSLLLVVVNQWRGLLVVGSKTRWQGRGVVIGTALEWLASGIIEASLLGWVELLVVRTRFSQEQIGSGMMGSCQYISQ